MGAVAHLACRSCGQQIYSVAPIEALFPEERRCASCNITLAAERRDAERRMVERRQSAPPELTPLPEGRQGERRGTRRRQSAANRSNPVYGWSAR
jgi:ribosomal protein L37E